ncbi:hypothetical protein B0H13DRAFT_2272060 [Mycena leptocephala]|nr:hypothetical protein B0H13DRAFT_2272060 [Mycena leptocephala]
MARDLNRSQIDVVMSIERNTHNTIEQLNYSIEGNTNRKLAAFKARNVWLRDQRWGYSPETSRMHAEYAHTTERKYIIPSIVYQLARHSSSFRHALVSVNQFGSCDEPDKQMKELLVNPWNRCLRDREFEVPPLLIIVDALDEIEDNEGAVFLAELLDVVRDGHLAGLRFLVTSRPEPNIVDLCNSFPSNAVCKLQEVGMADVGSDITTFLDAELPALQGKPQLPTNTRNPLLIDDLYQRILWSAFCHLEADQFSSRLENLHRIIDRDIRKVADDSDDSDIFDAVFGDLAGYPNSYRAEPELVTLIVNELHPVLYIKDGCIYWYHGSFPDFFLNPVRSKFTVTLPGGQKHTVDMFHAHGEEKIRNRSVAQKAKLTIAVQLQALSLAFVGGLNRSET